MSTYNCVIVDDEPMARQILASYCSNIKYLQVVASCENAFEATEALAKHQVDILFLDINMPVISGLNFLKTLAQPPQVILTTAYKEFALEGFDLGVCDYLLKPISIERFLKAVQKAIKAIPAKEESIMPQMPKPDAKQDELVFRTETKVLKIPVPEVLYLEAQGNYTNIVTTNEEYRIYTPLYKIEEELAPLQFLRIHRSYIVSLSRIRLADANTVKIGAKDLPIGRMFKDKVKQWMK
ncbi:MAG: response regulator transcription factor [Bacteroidetes bacterium]|nr:response regulator transcription factor [Bacteroidota bacterium]